MLNGTRGYPNIVIVLSRQRDTESPKTDMNTSGYHLGINMGHDRSVAVVQDGKVIVASEQERLDRIQHSVGFMLQSPDAMGHIQVPGESITYCLDHLSLKLGDVTTITPIISI